MTDENITLPLRLSYQLTRADVAAYERLPREFTRMGTLMFFGVFFVCGMGLALFDEEIAGILPSWLTDYRNIVSSIAAALLAYLICTIALTVRTNWRIAKADIPINEIEIEASQSDLQVSDGRAPRKLSWSSIARVIDTPAHVFLCLTPRSAVIVPVRAFSSADDMRAFADLSETLSRQADGDA
ncbi:MAG: YcxB family protein [Hyphomicrobium sp.]|uniref:YcxB family protein n=1 Tax=Hyphomicrobium sp. TaxID=82 RepID=UPI0039E33173